MTTIGLLQPLLQKANGHRDTYVAFHPCHWNLVSIVLEALDGEWDVRLRVSRDVSPHALYLCRDGQATPISRAQLSRPAPGTSMPPPGLNAGSHRAKRKPQPKVDPPGKETP